MPNKNEIWETILESVKSMTPKEYNETYESISENEDVYAIVESYVISISTGKTHLIDSQKIKYFSKEQLKPVFVESATESRYFFPSYSQVS